MDMVSANPFYCARFASSLNNSPNACFGYNMGMLFRIHRMKESARENFRWAAHTSGCAVVKPKDYEPAGEIESSSAYAAWTALRQTDRPLETGDILEDEAGVLRIAKYIGFETAQWWVPEPRSATPVALDQPAPEMGGTGTDLSGIRG
jgi:hypothetical protein